MKAQTIVITGAARGIGLELARQAAAKGARVIATARDVAKATELEKAVGDNGEVLELDIATDESVAKFATELKSIGVTKIDILINNAGVYLDSGATSLETTPSDVILDTFNINAVGPIRVTKALLPMLAQNAKIASLSSLMGSMTDNNSGGAYAYRMSKAAVNMFVKGFSVDERELISIALHPGWVKTEMGGAAAPLEIPKSAEGLWTVIETASPADSGKFFNHAGRELPW